MKVSGNNLTPEPQKFGIGYITEQSAFDILKSNSYNQLLLKIKGDKKQFSESFLKIMTQLIFPVL